MRSTPPSRRRRRPPLVRLDKPAPKRDPQERVLGGGKYGGNYQRIRSEMIPLFHGTKCPVQGCGVVMDAYARVGAPNKATLDHVKAAARGGLSVEENLRVICHRCNARKQANDDYIADHPGNYPPGYGIPPPSYPGCPPYTDW